MAVRPTRPKSWHSIQASTLPSTFQVCSSSRFRPSRAWDGESAAVAGYPGGGPLKVSGHVSAQSSTAATLPAPTSTVGPGSASGVRPSQRRFGLATRAGRCCHPTDVCSGGLRPNEGGRQGGGSRSPRNSSGSPPDKPGRPPSQWTLALPDSLIAAGFAIQRTNAFTRGGQRAGLWRIQPTRPSASQPVSSSLNFSGALLVREVTHLVHQTPGEGTRGELA